MKKDVILFIGVPIITTLTCGFLLTSNFIFADDVVDEVSFIIPVSCTMSGTGMDTHNVEIANGTYTPNIGTTTLHAFCNDNEGFAIYAAGYTGNEIGGTNSNKLVGTNASSNATIVSGIATTAGNPDISNWAMKLAISQDSGDTTTNAFTIDSAPNVDLPSQAEQSATPASFSQYHVVPNEYIKVAHKNSMTDMTATTGGVKLTTTYAAYISKTQPADTYTGQVIYTLVHPATEIPPQPQPSTAGCINYHANASSALGTMGCQPAADGDTITLLASNFSREGYGFAGWSDVFDYATNPDAHFYGPQEDIVVPEGTTAKGLSLYAIWVPSVGSLQDQTKVAELCGNSTQSITGSLITAPTDGTANLSSVSALTDQRDNQAYAIAKLADGNCWMIENLRLDNQYTVGNNQADPSVTNQSLSQGYNSSFIGLADPEFADFADSTTANSLYTIESGIESKFTISGSNLGYRFPRYNNTNTSSRATSPETNIDNSMYSHGNYYTSAAAIADTSDYTSGDHGTTSICPTGWRIPIGNRSTVNNSFGALSVALGGPEDGATTNATSTPTGSIMSTRFRSYPNNFLYSGRFFFSSISNRGDRGYYWSSTTGNADYSYYLHLYNSYVYPGTSIDRKYSGYSIRCTTGF